MTFKEHIGNFFEKVKFLFSSGTYKELKNNYITAINDYANIVNDNSKKDQEITFKTKLLSQRDIELSVKTKILQDNINLITQKDIAIKDKDSEIKKLKDDKTGISGKLELINNILSVKNEKLPIPYDKYDELKDLISLFTRKISVLKSMLCIKDDPTNKNEKECDENINQTILQFDNLLYKIKKRLIISGNMSIVLIGQFKTGKSSLLNKLFNLKLPTKISQATAVPTYISYSEINQIKVENHTGNIFITEEENILKNLEYKSDNDGILWSNIVKRIHYSTDKINTHGITFIDLPGYTGSDVDFDISMNEAKTADGVIFLVSKKGGLTALDIAFLKKLNESDIPILIVLSQIDTVPLTQIVQIEKQMIESLENNNIVYSSFIKYSTCKTPDKEIADIIKSSEKVLNKFLKEIKENNDEYGELRKILEDAIEEIKIGLNKIKSVPNSYFKLYDYFSKAKSILREINRDFSGYIESGFWGKSFLEYQFAKETNSKIKKLNNIYENIGKLNPYMSEWEIYIYYLAHRIVYDILLESVDLSKVTGKEKKINHNKTDEYNYDINEIRIIAVSLFENNPQKISDDIFVKDMQKILDQQKDIKNKILNKYLEVFTK